LTLREVARNVRSQLHQRHRYAHSVRVARLAASLARAHGEDVHDAIEAGLLHDVARLESGPSLILDCEARGLAIDDFERAFPVVLHARIGAEVARERFGVHAEPVLAAIRAHTLGRPGMSRLEEIVYLADGLEPGRDFPEREAYLKVAFSDLEEAMRLLLAASAAYLRGRGLLVAPLTLDAIAAYALREPAGSTVKEPHLCPI
jgi:predicted HD superfamily hydrolase involved in NAD metabolism